MSTSAYHRENLKAQLEDVAVEMLESAGPAALSLREVARRAGVSHNAPYRHFEDRGSLLRALGVRGMTAMVEAQESAFALAANPGDALTAVATAYLDYAVRHPGSFAIIYDPDICEPGNPSTAMAPLIRRNEALLERAVVLARPKLRERELLALVAAFWGAAHGLAQLTIAGHLDAATARDAAAALISMSLAAADAAS